MSVDVTDPTQPLPGAIVARKLGISRQLLRYWTTTGKLTPADHAHDGRPLYRTLDAAEVERTARRSPQSRRRIAA